MWSVRTDLPLPATIFIHPSIFSEMICLNRVVVMLNPISSSRAIGWPSQLNDDISWNGMENDISFSNMCFY